MTTKTKKSPLGDLVGDVNLSGMFDEMLGVTDADPAIIAPKFVQARNIIRRLTKVLAQFGTMATLRRNHPAIIPHLDEIHVFAAKVREDLFIKTDPDEPMTHFSTLSKEEINRVYRKLKENPATKRLVIMCGKLEKHKVNFENPEKLRENFVNAEPGFDLKIFDFSNLDLKYLWGICDIPSSAKKYILALLADLYKHSHALYNIITSPDVDIKAFTQTLISSISDLKKQPKLSRCHRAFRRIEMSVDLLQEKFSDYYRESIITQNPDTLVGNFIYDVSKQGKDDPKLMREFKVIIQYMDEISRKSGKSSDPKIKQVFAMLQANFNLMDRRAPAAADEATQPATQQATQRMQRSEPDDDPDTDQAAQQAAQQATHDEPDSDVDDHDTHQAAEPAQPAAEQVTQADPSDEPPPLLDE